MKNTKSRTPNCLDGNFLTTEDARSVMAIVTFVASEQPIPDNCQKIAVRLFWQFIKLESARIEKARRESGPPDEW